MLEELKIHNSKKEERVHKSFLIAVEYILVVTRVLIINKIK
jgi:hypothetical protein